MHAGKMRNRNSYIFRWVFRTHSLVELRHAGVRAVKYDPSTPLHQVRQGFPDQRNWMGESLVLSIGDVLSSWKYQGALEMFAIMLCVLCDAEIQEYDVEQLKALRSRIIEKRRAALEQHGYEGHPVLVLREASAE